MCKLGHISSVIRKCQYINVFQAICGLGKALSGAFALSDFPLWL